MKLIDKDALLAEIQRRISLFKKEKKVEKWSAEASQMNVVSLGARIAMLEELLSFIDTYEVKEVDLEHLEQEVKDFCYEYDDRKEKWYELCPNDRKLLYNPTWANFAMSIAKHFFKLGLKVAQKGENI